MKVFSSIAVQPAVEVLLPRFIAETGIIAAYNPRDGADVAY